MPTYEYACTQCGEHLEVVQSFKDDPLTKCPACGAALRKVFGNIGIVLKGSGFYKNDNRPASKSKSTSAAESSSTPTPETKKESTPATSTKSDSASSSSSTPAPAKSASS